jgi:hypothetical protein
MNIAKASVLLLTVICCSTLMQSLPRSMAVRDDRLAASQIDQAFFRDLEYYRLAAAARRARAASLPTAARPVLSSTSVAVDYDRG